MIALCGSLPGVPEVALGIVCSHQEVEHQQGHAVAKYGSVEHWASQVGRALLCYECHPGNGRIERHCYACSQR